MSVFKHCSIMNAIVIQEHDAVSIVPEASKGLRRPQYISIAFTMLKMDLSQQLHSDCLTPLYNSIAHAVPNNPPLLRLRP